MYGNIPDPEDKKEETFMPQKIPVPKALLKWYKDTLERIKKYNEENYK